MGRGPSERSNDDKCWCENDVTNGMDVNVMIVEEMRVMIHALDFGDANLFGKMFVSR